MSGRGRTFLLLGVVVLLGVAAVVVLMTRGGNRGGAAVTPTPVVAAQVVVAVQDIPRGGEILTETVALRAWPADQVPPGAMMEVQAVLGQFARFDIPKGLPLLPAMLAPTRGGALFTPSQLPGQIPAGKVAVALPISRLSSVAYAIKPGDHVDALASFLVLDLDEEFQTRLANKFVMAVPSPEGVVTFIPMDPAGRDRNPVLGFQAIEQPSERQRPRLVAQLTVQNMLVLGVGDWLSQSQPEVAATPAADQAQAPTPNAAAQPDVVTVIVEPQDALVLKFLRESGAAIDLALRSADDAEQMFATESVTLQYMFTRFEVAQPPKLTYGIEPHPTPVPTPQPQ